jgi:hypothetical protein
MGFLPFAVRPLASANAGKNCATAGLCSLACVAERTQSPSRGPPNAIISNRKGRHGARKIVVDAEKHHADRGAGFNESGAVRTTAILRVDHLARATRSPRPRGHEHFINRLG